MYKVVTCYADELQDTLNKNKDKKLIQILPVTFDGTLKQYSIVYAIIQQTAVYEAKDNGIDEAKEALNRLYVSSKKETKGELEKAT